MSMANSSPAPSTFSEQKKKENCIIDFPFSPAQPSCTIFDMIPSQSEEPNSSSFAGYIDLLTTHDFTSSSATPLFHWFPNNSTSTTTFDTDDTSASKLPAATTQTNHHHHQQEKQPSLPELSTAAAVSEVLNNPATPASFSSSISSSSNETGISIIPVTAENEAEDKEGGDDRIRLVENQNDQIQDQTKKLLKPKKKNKKERAPRITFNTKSDIDHLDDGYRWRKYGQKPVKNSAYPRSYYRCTAPGCDVKKRIERLATDRSTVLTSYEGQHTHMSPILLRDARLGIMPDGSGFQDQIYQHSQTNSVGGTVLENQFAISESQYQQFQDQNQNETSLLFDNDYNNIFNIGGDNFMNSSTLFSGTFLQNQENYGGGNPSLLACNFERNNGLLQDMIVPMEMRGGAGNEN